MYFSTEVLSVQNIDSVNDMCNSFFQKVSKRLANVAAVSSMRGIETDFKGDTLDFPMTKLLCTRECTFCSSTSGELLEEVQAITITVRLTFNTIFKGSHECMKLQWITIKDLNISFGQG